MCSRRKRHWSWPEQDDESVCSNHVGLAPVRREGSNAPLPNRMTVFAVQLLTRYDTQMNVAIPHICATFLIFPVARNFLFPHHTLVIVKYPFTSVLKNTLIQNLIHTYPRLKGPHRFYGSGKLAPRSGAVPCPREPRSAKHFG